MADIDVQIIPESTVTVEVANDIIVTNPFTLPTATANTLGGIKVGENLSITDGVLSASFDLSSLSDETNIDNSDSVPFYDASAMQAKKTPWSNVKVKLKAFFDTSYKGIESYPLAAGTNLFFNNIANSQFFGNYNVLGGYAPSADYKSFVYANYAFVHGLSCRALDEDATNTNAQADFGATFGKNLWNCSHGLLCGVNGKNATDDLLSVANGSSIYSPNGIVFRVKSNGAAQTAHVPTDANDLTNKAYVDSVAGSSSQMSEIIELTEEVNIISVDIPEGISDVEIELKVPSCESVMTYGYFLVNGVQTTFSTTNWGNSTGTTSLIKYNVLPTGAFVTYSAPNASAFSKIQDSVIRYYGVTKLTSVGVRAYGTQTFPVGTILGIKGR